MTDWHACVAMCVVVAIALEGCGGGAKTTPAPGTTVPPTTTSAAGTTSAKPATSTTTHTTVPPTPPPGKPWDGKKLAALMNMEYHSYVPSNKSSGKGLYLRLTEDPEIYCHKGCYQGKPDCKISGSIVNDKQMYDHVNRTISVAFGKATAWYVNTTKVFSQLGKCSFVWDGGTDAKLNGGCGCNIGGSTDCNSRDAAYYDKCDGVKCTDKSPDVTRCECSNIDKSQWPVDWTYAPKCFWKGPAFYPPSGTFPDETREMLDWRVQHQAAVGTKPWKDQYSYWNEMVLDGELLLEEMAKDPVGTIPAIVYFPSIHGLTYARNKAKELAAKFKETYFQPHAIPIIMVNETADVVSGDDPFLFVPEHQVAYDETIVL